MVIAVLHMVFLKSNSTDIKVYNSNWWKSMNGTFSDENLKATFKDIETLEVMQFWEVAYRT